MYEKRLPLSLTVLRTCYTSYLLCTICQNFDLAWYKISTTPTNIRFIFIGVINFLCGRGRNYSSSVPYCGIQKLATMHDRALEMGLVNVRYRMDAAKWVWSRTTTYHMRAHVIAQRDPTFACTRTMAMGFFRVKCGYMLV